MGKGIKDTCRGRGVVWREVRGGVWWGGWDGRRCPGCGRCTGWGLCGARRCRPGPCSRWRLAGAGTVSSLESLSHSEHGGKSSELYKLCNSRLEWSDTQFRRKLPSTVEVSEGILVWWRDWAWGCAGRECVYRMKGIGREDLLRGSNWLGTTQLYVTEPSVSYVCVSVCISESKRPKAISQLVAGAPCLTIVCLPPEIIAKNSKHTNKKRKYIYIRKKLSTVQLCFLSYYDEPQIIVAPPCCIGTECF